MWNCEDRQWIHGYRAGDLTTAYAPFNGEICAVCVGRECADRGCAREGRDCGHSRGLIARIWLNIGFTRKEILLEEMAPIYMSPR